MTDTGWLVVELDALCDYAHRIDLRNAGEWDEFHERSVDDKPNLDVVDFINMVQQAAHMHVLIFTGRPVKYAKLTQEWLARHNVHPDVLAMRQGEEWAKDEELKLGILEAEFGDKKAVLDNVWIVLDTKEKSIAAMRNYGLTVWMPRQGGY